MGGNPGAKIEQLHLKQRSIQYFYWIVTLYLTVKNSEFSENDFYTENFPKVSHLGAISANVKLLTEPTGTWFSPEKK